MENMHDVPYTKRIVGPEIVSSMTSVCCSVKEIADQLPCGVQILSGCNQEALAVAKVTNIKLSDFFLFFLFTFYYYFWCSKYNVHKLFLTKHLFFYKNTKIQRSLRMSITNSFLPCIQCQISFIFLENLYFRLLRSCQALNIF